MEGLHRPEKKGRISSQIDENRVQVRGRDLIDDLPDELLIYIFSFIRVLKDRCCCGAVSKKWFLMQVSMPRSDYASHGFHLPRPSQEISRSFKGEEANDLRLAAMAIGIDARGILTELSVVGTLLKVCTGLTDRCFARVSPTSLAGIMKLAVNNCSSLIDLGLFELTRSAQKLESLLLHSCNACTYRGLMLDLGNCSQSLRILTLIKCGLFGQEEVQHGREQNSFPDLPHCCPLLENVKLDQCSGVGDDFISWIGESCKRVTDVRFMRMDSVTDRGIQCFVNQLKGSNKITRVDLTGCTGVGNRSVWAITREYKAIKSLVLNGCHRVTDRGVAVIARRCTKLVELDPGGCDISDEGVKKLGREEPMELEVISLAGCTRITDRSLMVLKGDMGPVLDRVNVAGCTGVSKAMINCVMTQRKR